MRCLHGIPKIRQDPEALGSVASFNMASEQSPSKGSTRDILRFQTLKLSSESNQFRSWVAASVALLLSTFCFSWGLWICSHLRQNEARSIFPRCQVLTSITDIHRLIFMTARAENKRTSLHWCSLLGPPMTEAIACKTRAATEALREEAHATDVTCNTWR